MATPCTHDPNEVIEKVVSAKNNADKFDKFVNGTDTQTVQLGSGDPTPTIRNVVRQVKADGEWIKQFIADAPEGDVSLNNAAAMGGTASRTLADRFSDFLHIADFGAVGDGVTDDTAAIEAAIAAGADAGKRLFFDGGKTYVISGDSDVAFVSGAEFNGATLDISGFNHTVYLNSPGEGWVEDSEALSLIAAGSDTSNETTKISAWSEYAGVSNSYVWIDTNQYYYTYRGEDVDRTEINFVTDRGQLLSPIRYAIAADSVVAVKKMSYNRKTTEYSNVNFKINGRQPTIYSIVAVLNSSNVKIKNISFESNDIISYEDGSLFTLVDVKQSGHIEINGVYFGSPIHVNGNSASYCLNLWSSYDVLISKAIGQGAGWGATGGNNCWRVVFRDSDINRVDFHQPFREYLKIQNCNIGRTGITVTAIGNLYIEDSVLFNESSNITGESSFNFINARGELYGVCDGDVYVNNCRIINNLSGGRLFVCKDGIDTDKIKEGSPLTQVFWHTINVSNLECSGPYPLNIAPLITKGKAPRSIFFNVVKGPCYWEQKYNEGESYITGENSWSKGVVFLKDFDYLTGFCMVNNVSGVYKTQKTVIIENAVKTNSSGFIATLRTSATVVFKNCDINQIYDVSISGHLMDVFFDCCRINTNNTNGTIVFTNVLNKIRFSRCIFVYQPTLETFTETIQNPVNSEQNITGKIGHICFDNNTVISKATGENKDLIVFQTFDTPTTQASFALPEGVDNSVLKNKYLISLGVGGDVEMVDCVLPYILGSRTYPVTGGSCVISRQAASDPVVITSTSEQRLVRSFSVLI